MIFHLGNLFTFIGGIGIFLYGMKIMSEGLQKIAGSKLSNILKMLTSNKFLAIAVGALVTALIHSSAATTVMVVGFVDSGVMQLTEAVGVIMGANIGTTITAWIVSLTQLGNFLEVLKPEFYAPLIFGIGAIVVVFAKKEKTTIKANIFVGIGLLFLGLTLMAAGVEPYSKSQVFVDAFEILGKNPFLAVLAGLVVTALLSSSTASVSILQTLAAAGSVTKGAACFITVGQNIGTCVTTIISSLKSSKNGKRTALLHLLFNVLGAIIFSVIVFLTYGFIENLLASKISVVEISIFHTGFNILNTLILLPFANGLVAITKKIIPDGNEEDIDFSLSDKTIAILNDKLLKQPSVALSSARREVLYYSNYTFKNLKRSTNLILADRSEELIKVVVDHEEEIDKTTKILMDYLMKINHLQLSERQAFEVESLISICSDIERIGDHAENISEKATELLENDAKFSEIGFSEIANYIKLAEDAVEYAIKAVEDKDMEAVKVVRKNEELADTLEDEYRANHIKRFSSGECNNVAGLVFLDVINNLERVTDHANNLADYVEAEYNKYGLKKASK